MDPFTMGGRTRARSIWVYHNLPEERGGGGKKKERKKNPHNKNDQIMIYQYH